MRLSITAILSLTLATACSSDPLTFAEPELDAGGNATYSYHQDVAPIIAERCLLCHGDDEETRSAPFPLTSYADAFKWGEAGLLPYVVENRLMPPFAANDDGDCGSYKESLWLTQGEIDTLVGWVEGGMSEGEPEGSPPPPPAPPNMLDPTVVMNTPSYAPADWISDDYHCFIIDPELAEDLFLTDYNVIPSDTSVNHHGTLSTLNGAAALAEAEALDAAEPGPGYTCFGGTGVSDSTPVAGWVPGVGVQHYPKDTGIRIKKGSKMVLQMHNNYGDPGDMLKQTTVEVKLKLAQSVTTPASLQQLRHRQLSVPAGMEYGETATTTSAPGGATIWGILPHMHLMGRKLRLERDGGECLFRADAYDFQWQRLYWYENPIAVKKGDNLTITCGYDTRGAEQDPVVWGEGSEEEMCMVVAYVTE